MKNTKSILRESPTGQIVIAGVLLVILIGLAFIIVNAQVENNGAKYIQESNIHDKYNSSAPDIQEYASHMNISVVEAIYRFQLIDVGRMMQAEMSIKENKTFAGMWVEHTPKFKFVVRFTKDGEEKIKSYILKYPDLANMIEVHTADMSLVDLRVAHDSILYSISVSNISINSNINIVENCIELYVNKKDYSQLKDTIEKIKLPDNVKNKVKVIPVERLAEPATDIYGGLSLPDCTIGFSVIKSSVSPNIKGVTTAGHCNDIQSYNGVNLPFQSENWGGSYDIQWHTAPGLTVTNKIQVSSSGSTRTIYGIVPKDSQMIGQYICKYGKTTKYTCGYINSKNFNPGGRWNAPTYIWVRNTAGYNVVVDLGDSGGPFFRASGSGAYAYGTTTHKLEPGTNGQGADGIYMAVDYLESGLGVSVITG